MTMQIEIAKSVSSEWAKDYRLQKTRIDTWNTPLFLGIPVVWLLVSFAVVFSLSPVDAYLAVFTLLLVWVVFMALTYYISRKLIGFCFTSDLKCPRCGIAAAYYKNGWTIDWQCRDCGHPHARAAGL